MKGGQQPRTERESPRPVRPASVLLETPGPDLAAFVEQALSDLAPSRVRAAKLHGVEPLDLDGAPAAGAVNPEQFARDLRQPHLLDRQPWPSGGARIPQKRVPIFRRQRAVRWGSSVPAVRTGLFAIFSICFGVGIRQEAG
jgi:hypothetical protein